MPLINELVRIIFPQNMKSMEKYYRWLSKLYVMTFGKLHMGLVDTIFRYNNREIQGRTYKSLWVIALDLHFSEGWRKS